MPLVLVVPAVALLGRGTRAAAGHSGRRRSRPGRCRARPSAAPGDVGSRRGIVAGRGGDRVRRSLLRAWPSSPRSRSAPVTLGVPVGLVEVTRENVEAVCRLRVAERQERLVAPAAQTVAEAKCHGPAAYLRAITSRAGPSAWCGFRPTSRCPISCGSWSTPSGKVAGSGGGPSRSYSMNCARWDSTSSSSATFRSRTSAERFWLACGFQPTGRMHGDEALVRMDLR